jgi:isopentenyldiphosphate isomerase
MLQPTQVAQAEVPAKQHTQQLNAETDTTTTATDNEMKNTAVKPTYKHAETIYAEHKGDIEEMSDALYGNTAAADIAEQEPQPILLAETETQIEIEQNLVADTAYMIADAGEVYDVLEMYCSTRCSSNEVIVSLDRLMENTDIM